MNDNIQIKKSIRHLNNQLNTIKFLLNEEVDKAIINENNKNTYAEPFIFITSINENLFSNCPEANLVIKKLHKEYQKIQDMLNNLNSKLKKPQKNIIDIKNINDKEFISVKEFTILYGYSAAWQSQKRSKIHDPLPRVSEGTNKILYSSIAIKKWFENYLNE